MTKLEIKFAVGFPGSKGGAFQNISKHLTSRYVKGVPFSLEGIRKGTFSVKNGI